MALSMFLRRQVCSGQIVTSHLRKLAIQPPVVQPSLALRTLASLPSTTFSLKEKIPTPMFNPVRDLKTTAVKNAGVDTPHDQSRLWVIEKVSAALMVPAIPLALAFPNKVLDIVVAILISAHSFWGMEAVAIDYVRASIFGTVLPKVAIGVVYLFHFAILGGLLYIITHDVGISNLIRQFWSIKRQQNA